MPDVCRQYDCFWREHDSLPESWRPDRVGIVVTEGGNVTVGHRLLPVVLFQEDLLFQENAAETRLPDGAGDSDFASPSSDPQPCSPPDRIVAAREMLDHFVRRGFAVMIICGLRGRIEFDRGRWPGVSAAEIEAALRYEMSQDADELKQLGAVGDDYRPLTRDEAQAACREEPKPLS